MIHPTMEDFLQAVDEGGTSVFKRHLEHCTTCRKKWDDIQNKIAQFQSNENDKDLYE